MEARMAALGENSEAKQVYVAVPLRGGESRHSVYFEGEEPLKNKCYYKYELQAMYGVLCHKRFKRQYIEPIADSLVALGYSTHTKILSHAMMRVFIDFHGEP